VTADQRKSSRIPLIARVRVMHPNFGQRILKSKDISDGGMFIISDACDWPAVGSRMQVQALDTPVEAEMLLVQLVRKTPQGVGVMFVDE